jgi:hypothetical protein
MRGWCDNIGICKSTGCILIGIITVGLTSMGEVEGIRMLVELFEGLPVRLQWWQRVLHDRGRSSEVLLIRIRRTAYIGQVWCRREWAQLQV